MLSQWWSLFSHEPVCPLRSLPTLISYRGGSGQWSRLPRSGPARRSRTAHLAAIVRDSRSVVIGDAADDPNLERPCEFTARDGAFAAA
jgi:hypothetical protein